MYANPTYKRHKPLEKAENSGNYTHFSPIHARLVKSVSKRNREGIHSESYAKQDAVKKENKINHSYPFAFPTVQY